MAYYTNSKYWMHKSLIDFLLRKYNQNEPLTELQLHKLIRDLRSCGMADKEIDKFISEHWSI
jgi:hypothetical protein